MMQISLGGSNSVMLNNVVVVPPASTHNQKLKVLGDMCIRLLTFNTAFMITVFS